MARLVTVARVWRAEASDPDVVYLESQTGSLYLEEAPATGRYALMFSHLIAKALDPDESRRLIGRVANDLTGLPTQGGAGWP